jgi:MFS transporter, ACS family, hexuronate transporter
VSSQGRADAAGRSGDHPDAADAAAGIGRYRWVICALLFLATTVNYVDRQILALVKEFLDRELGWTNEQFGLVNSAFLGAYGVGVFAWGWVIDRYGTKLGYAWSIATWSVAAIAHALVGSVGGFLGARMFLGVSEGGNFPAAIKAVALWFPRNERAFATAIFNSGTNVGAIVAPAIVPVIALAFGWRTAFVLAGVAGLLWLLLWLPFYDVPEKQPRVSTAEFDYIRRDKDEGEAGGVPMGWRRALRYKQTWSFVVAKFMTDPVWWFFLIWLPDYFKATRGLDIKRSWLLVATIYLIATVLSIGGGWLTGGLQRRGWSVTRARKTGMFLFAACVVPILAVTRVGDWPAVLLIGFAGAAHQAWSANLFTTVSDMFPKKDVGTIVGLGGLAGSTGGMLFPWLSGRLLDQFHAAGNATGGYAILFGICAFMYLVSFGFHHLLAPRFDPLAMTE